MGANPSIYLLHDYYLYVRVLVRYFIRAPAAAAAAAVALLHCLLLLLLRLFRPMSMYLVLVHWYPVKRLLLCQLVIKIMLAVSLLICWNSK